MTTESAGKILIHGWGEEGVAAIRHFAALASRPGLVLIADRPERVPEAVRRSVDAVVGEAEFAAAPCRYGNDDSIYLRSPGVGPSNAAVAAARALGWQVTTPTGYWLERQPGEKILVVTGSKGKSTTSSLTHELLTWGGKSSLLLGNIGIPALSETPKHADYFVAELSSYQLWDFAARPRLCAVTNIFTEHTDWHGSHEEYVRAKLGPLLRHGDVPYLTGRAYRDELLRCAGGGVAPEAFSLVEEYVQVLSADGRGRGLRIFGADRDVALSTIHPEFASRILTDNLAVAVAAVLHAGLLSPQQCVAVLETHLAGWRPLAHRRELLSTDDGRHWVDDSLATIPEATLHALDDWPGHRIFVLVGGRDRGQRWEGLIERVAQEPGVTALVFGEIRAPFESALADSAVDRGALARFVFADDFPAALAHAAVEAPKGAVILFSPAAASSPPHSYKDRSAMFRETARRGR